MDAQSLKILNKETGETASERFDRIRFSVFDQLTCSQKNIFVLGTCFHSAYWTHRDEINKKVIPPAAQRELDCVRDILKQENIESEILQ
jgi:hypothetical protein